MESTPQRKEKARPQTTPRTTPRTPVSCPYKGISFICPGEVFDQPDITYEAVVKGWNGKKTDQLICKFDDGSQYWFPIEDVLKWMGGPAARQAAAAVTGGPSSPVSPRTRGSRDRSPEAPSSNIRRRTVKGSAEAAAAAAEPAAVYTPAAAQVEAGGTADEVFDLPLLAKDDEQGGSAQLQRQASAADLQRQADYACGVVGGMLLLLIVMVTAIAASRAAAHDLEAWLDKLSGLVPRTRRE